LVTVIKRTCTAKITQGDAGAVEKTINSIASLALRRSASCVRRQ